MSLSSRIVALLAAVVIGLGMAWADPSTVGGGGLRGPWGAVTPPGVESGWGTYSPA